LSGHSRVLRLENCGFKVAVGVGGGKHWVAAPAKLRPARHQLRSHVRPACGARSQHVATKGYGPVTPNEPACRDDTGAQQPEIFIHAIRQWRGDARAERPDGGNHEQILRHACAGKQEQTKREDRSWAASVGGNMCPLNMPRNWSRVNGRLLGFMATRPSQWASITSSG